MYYKPDHFELHEVFPRHFYKAHKHRGANLWFVFDQRILWTMDRLRKKFGRIVINTWFWGGNSQYRGFRPFNCGVGARFSQHKFGRAIDSVPLDYPVEKIRNQIINEPGNPDFKYITCIEKNVSWLHIDVRNWNKEQSKILIIKP